MRKPIVAGNWKMNKTPAEAAAFVDDLLEQLVGIRCDVLLAPPFVCLERVAERLNGSPIGLAAQNAHWEAAGAFTGEVSVPMLSELGVSHVIVGHSERRQFFGETDETVNRRAKAVLNAGLIPIICVGETLAERSAGITAEVVAHQLRRALEGLAPARVGNIIVAYEPVWAIGTGRVATTEQAQEVHALIRALIAQLHGERAASTIRLQYGGSVKADNAAGLLSKPDIDGALVGGASLSATEFAAICQSAC